jgi:sensor histidine kinase YesM
MLQSQISPHFLYNTLGTIKWMAAIQGADGIAEITTALSRLLRTVANDIRKTAPLREELKFLDDYIVIQKYRYGDSISFEKEIEDESLLDYAIPKLTLQPFVENAIFHGLEPKGGGRILIRVARDGGDALISLTDNGVGMGAEAIAEALGAGAAPGTRQGQRQERTKRRAPGQRETRQGQRAQGETAPTPASEPEPERQPEPASAPEQQDGIIKMFGIKNVDERLRHAFGPDYGVSIVSEPGSYTTACVRVPPAREEFP